ncbi:MAG: EpsG family protein [Clostridia bacterium]|nr:EpsG family protein [Clostridia bacterium]
MEVYTMAFIIACVFSVFASTKKNGKYKKLAYTLLAFLPFTIVAAIRYDVGTDYLFRNVPDYNKLVLGNDVSNLEPLFKLIIKTCIFFSKDYVILFVVTSIIMYTFIAITVNKNSKNILLSVIVFMVGSYYFQSLNLVRQFLGISIMFFAYRYMIDKKYIRWFICLFLATMLHTSCLIFIITLFFDKKVFKLIYLIIGIILIVLIGYPLFNKLLEVLGNSDNMNFYKYKAYLLWQDKGINFSSLIPEIVIYFYFYIIYYKKRDILDKEGIYFINLQFFSVLLVLMTLYSSLFYRILLMFAVFQILSIPYFWSLCHHEKNINIKKTVITINTFICICVLGVMSLKMVYSSIIKGNGEVLPYKTIWERDK